MKYLFFYISVLFFKIINTFTPFITKYFFSYKSNTIVKTLSGLLQNIAYINNTIFTKHPNSIIETQCNLEKCNIMIPGYMDHEPKAEAILHEKNTKSIIKNIKNS